MITSIGEKMNKASRNEPCPCGSGKKYKKCCIDKILSFPVKDSFEGVDPKSSSKFLDMVKSEFEMGEYNSLDEMNEKLNQFSQNYNELPQSPFLGLSPQQMSSVLYSPFSLYNALFNFESTCEHDFMKIPILNQAIYFLNKLKDVVELKVTQNGNLPRAFVIELYENFFSEDRYARKPNREDDLPQATRLKHLLDLAGLIKKRHGEISLTKKGLSIIDNQKPSKLYEVIFLNYTNKWNWGYDDGYPDFPLMQQSASFNLLLIAKKCDDWTLDTVLGKLYIDAFPALSREAEDCSYSTGEEQIICCFSIRFLKQVCVPLGLLEFKEQRVKKGEYFEILEYFKATDFFKNNFKFKI
jgi:hypothetical protein